MQPSRFLVPGTMRFRLVLGMALSSSCAALCQWWLIRDQVDPIWKLVRLALPLLAVNLGWAAVVSFVVQVRLRTLVKAFERIAQGDLGTRLPRAPASEFRMVESAFATMSDALREANDSLPTRMLKGGGSLPTWRTIWRRRRRPFWGSSMPWVSQRWAPRRLLAHGLFQHLMAKRPVLPD